MHITNSKHSIHAYTYHSRFSFNLFKKAKKPLFIFLALYFKFSGGILYSAEHIQSVAITQITAHSSLDQVQAGIVDTLKKTNENIHIEFSNAYGDQVIASQIADKFASKDFDAIVAITTPSAQYCLNSLKRKKKQTPLVFSSVTDPIGAGLIKNLTEQSKQVTGVINKVSAEEHLELITKVLPKTKRIGILINYSEQNSVNTLKELERCAKKLDIEIVASSITNSSLASTALNSLIGKIDTLFLLQDNTTASAMPVILKIAKKQKLPVFSAYIEAVNAGALMSYAPDEYKIGIQTANMVLKILNKDTNLPVEYPLHYEKVINISMAKELGISIPEEILKTSTQIE